jgi:hypothetical protein
LNYDLLKKIVSNVWIIFIHDADFMDKSLMLFNQACKFFFLSRQRPMVFNE